MYKLITSLAAALIFMLPLLVTASVYGERQSDDIIVVEPEQLKKTDFVDISPARFNRTCLQ